jgi:acyl-coenzyme A synthetase/AMP-(fatty) acid ligase
VRAAVVTAIGDPRGDKRLIGYVTAPAADGDALAVQLRECLTGRLPTHIMVLEELPLTRNGKVDRKALPMPGRRAR